MQNFIVKVNYTVLDSSNNVVTKTGMYVMQADSEEEAITAVIPAGERLAARMNGTFISCTVVTD
jgi:hypothetical protein